MNPIVFAMRRPVTTMMLVVALISGGLLGLTKMRVDIFPSLHTPKIYVYPRLRRHEPRPDGGVHRQPARALFPVRRRHLGHRHAEHPAGLALRALVLPRHRHGPGDGAGRGDVRPRHVVDAQGDAAADDHAHGRRQRPRRLPRDGEQGDLARPDGRPGAEHHPAAGAEVRPGHRRDLAVRPEHAVDPHQRQPRQAPAVQPEPPARHRRRGEGEHRRPGGQPLHQGLDADRRQQRDRRRHPEPGEHPPSHPAERLPPRRGELPGRHRHYLWIRARQRQEVGLSADHQEGHGVDADRRGRHPQVDAAVPRRRAEGRDDQLRVRRVAHGDRGGPERRERGRDRRDPDRAS